MPKIESRGDCSVCGREVTTAMDRIDVDDDDDEAKPVGSSTGNLKAYRHLACGSED